MSFHVIHRPVVDGEYVLATTEAFEDRGDAEEFAETLPWGDLPIVFECVLTPNVIPGIRDNNDQRISPSHIP